jgi:hypothetical protein
MNFLSKTIIGFGLLSTSFVSSYAADPKAKPQATPQPLDIKSMMIQRCVQEATVLKVMDAKTAQRVCACTTNVQANQLKLGEFWDIQSAAENGKDPRSLAALQRIQPALAKCREGAKISPPVYPTAPATPNKP